MMVSRILGTALAGCLPAAALAAALATTPAHADPVLAGRHAVSLAGQSDGWGFASLTEDGGQLLLARRELGLTLLDTATDASRTIPGTEGANAVLEVKAADRVYAAAMDGSIIVIRASDHQVLKRLPVDPGNLNNLLLDRASGQVLVTSGRRGKVSHVYRLDPSCDCIRGTLALPAAKLDGPVLIEPGRVAIPMRDEGKLAIVDMGAMALAATWDAPMCPRPSALAADPEGARLFVACRGKDARLLTLDAHSGALVATAAAGRDINALAYDARRGWLLAPSGTDARLTVFDASQRDRLQRIASIGTRPWAHNMTYDARRGIAYLPSMDDTELYDAQGKPAERHFAPDSFAVTMLKLRPSIARQKD